MRENHFPANMTNDRYGE